MPLVQLGRLFKTLRTRIEPSVESLGSYERARSRRGRPVTQEEVAEAIGTTRVWYAMLESGAALRTTAQLLGRLADTLTGYAWRVLAGDGLVLTAIRRPGLSAQQLERVLTTIVEKIGEPISVSALSSVAGLSRSYFSHAFRTSVGRTPHAHVVRLRIEHAIILMAQSEVSLTDVALAAGFADQSHFSRSFRCLMGVTPAHWRRERRTTVQAAPRALRYN